MNEVETRRGGHGPRELDPTGLCRCRYGFCRVQILPAAWPRFVRTASGEWIGMADARQPSFCIQAQPFQRASRWRNS